MSASWGLLVDVTCIYVGLPDKFNFIKRMSIFFCAPDAGKSIYIIKKLIVIAIAILKSARIPTFSDVRVPGFGRDPVLRAETPVTSFVTPTFDVFQMCVLNLEDS